MDERLKKWEVALIFGLLVTVFLGGWLRSEQEALAGQVIRLHVVANSDSPRDQAMKLAVRDRVLAAAEGLYDSETDRSEALTILAQNLPELERAGREVLLEWDCDERISAHLAPCWFPTKEYGNFALPAGEYTALKVLIGEGEGQNWWCVAFPPLCLGAASETVEQAAQAGNFTPGQAALITGETGGYVLKFKAMELLGELQRIF